MPEIDSSSRMWDMIASQLGLMQPKWLNLLEASSGLGRQACCGTPPSDESVLCLQRLCGSWRLRRTDQLLEVWAGCYAF